MAVPTIAATATATETTYNSSDWSIPLTGLGTISAGDLLLALVGFAVGAPRDWAAPSGWTRINWTNDGGAKDLYVIAKRADGGETSATWAKSSANGGGSACLYRITGWYGATTNGVEASVANSGTDNPPSLAPTWGTSEEHLWLAGTVAQNGTTISTWPTNYSASQIQVADGQTIRAGLCAYTNKAASSSEDPGAFTLSPQSSLVTTIGIRPAAGGASEAVPIVMKWRM